LCPIFFKRLLREHDLEDMFSVTAAMMTLHFDHCIPRLKHTTRPGIQYAVHTYWYHAPLVLEFGMENLSGYFVHASCHKRDT
jgi:hypothetical protein